MSDFLLIADPTWDEIPNATELVLSYGEDSLMGSIRDGVWGDVDQLVEAAGYLPLGWTVSNARMIAAGSDPSSRIRLWCQYIPNPQPI